MSLADIRTKTAVNNANGISIHVVLFFTDNGYIIEETPSIPRILKILLPIIFPRTISVLLFIAAKILTTISGADVPKATIVNPITIFGIFNFFARDDDPSTKIFAPTISGKKPTMTRSKFNI
jgi:hypothetical protein